MPAGSIVSRFGPTLPTALAAASVWQTPQCWPNSSRPCFSPEVSVIPPTCALALVVVADQQHRRHPIPNAITKNANIQPTARFDPRLVANPSPGGARPPRGDQEQAERENDPEGDKDTDGEHASGTLSRGDARWARSRGPVGASPSGLIAGARRQSS